MTRNDMISRVRCKGVKNPSVSAFETRSWYWHARVTGPVRSNQGIAVATLRECIFRLEYPRMLGAGERQASAHRVSSMFSWCRIDASDERLCGSLSFFACPGRTPQLLGKYFDASHTLRRLAIRHAPSPVQWHSCSDNALN